MKLPASQSAQSHIQSGAFGWRFSKMPLESLRNILPRHGQTVNVGRKIADLATAIRTEKKEFTPRWIGGGLHDDRNSIPSEVGTQAATGNGDSDRVAFR